MLVHICIGMSKSHDALHTTSLESTRLSSAYQGSLETGWRLFSNWLKQNHVALSLSRKNAASVDQVLAEFVQWCFHSDVKLWIVRHAALSVQFVYRELRGYIPRAWDSIRSWQDRMRWDNRRPLPLAVLRALFAVVLSWSFDCPQLARHIIPLAVLVRLGFFGLLRPAELFRLRVRDVVLPSFDVAAAVVAIHEPKTRQHMGRSQFATVADPSTIEYLSWLLHSVGPNVKIWPSSPLRFRQMFGVVMEKLELSGCRFTVSSLRAGGATNLALQNMDLGRRMFLGRWKNIHILSSCIQESVARRVWLEIADGVQMRIDDIVAQSDAVWLNPPSVKWSKLFSRRRQWQSSRRVLSAKDW